MPEGSGFLTLIVIPVALVLIIVFLLLFARLMGRFYVKVAPNEVLVKFGRRYTWDDGHVLGYKLITGGASWVLPFLESARTLPLSAFQLKLNVTNVPSQEGVRVTVGAVAIVKVGTEEMMLKNAVNRFLDSNLEQIGAFAKEALEGSLRGVVARLTVEELVKDRTKFSAEVQEQVTPDLRRLGLILDNFLIQEIGDTEGYIDALGAKRTAEVKRDAAIAEAYARRDEEIRVAEAIRESKIKSSEAQRDGDVAMASAMQQISDAVRQKEVVEAQNNAKIMAEQAKVKIIADQSAAEEERKLRVLRVQAEEAEVLARTGLQDKERSLNEKKLEATVIVESRKGAEAKLISAEGAKNALLVEANAAREADVIKAGGEKLAATERAMANYVVREKEAEAARLSMELEGRGRKEQQTAEAEGLKALAEAKQKELEAEAAGLRATRLAEAEGQKAKLLAEAEGMRQRLLAEAEGLRARGLAEAEAILQKAKAFNELGKAGQMLEILARIPAIIDEVGSAGKEIVTPIAEAMAKGLGQVSEVRIIDMGGANGQASSLERFAASIPKTVFNTLQSANALGLGKVMSELAEKLNISPEALAEFIDENHGKHSTQTDSHVDADEEREK